MADKDNMLNRDDENNIASSVFVKAPRIGSEPINGKMVESKTSSETSLGSGDISTIRSEMYQKGSQFANSNDTGTLVNHDGSVRSSTSKTAEWSTWLGDKVSYNKRQTIKEIGRHLSERMQESIRANGGNEETSAAIPGVLGYPGNGKVNAYGLSGKYSENPVEGAYDYYTGKEMTADYLDLAGFNETKVRKAEDAKNKSDAFPYGLAMGESMVLNPDFQFNELDDVRANWRTPYIGALYNERIYAFNLPKVFFQVGTVSINMKMITGLSALWFNNRAGKSLSEYLKDPSSTNVIKKIAANLQGMIGTTASSIARILMRNKRMYKFTPNNAVFLKYVDEILAEIAAWMGLTNSDIENDNKHIKNLVKEKYKDSADDENMEYGAQNMELSAEEQAAFGVTKQSDGSYVAGGIFDGSSEDANDFPKYSYLGKRQMLSVLDILPMSSDVRTAPSDNNDFFQNLGDSLYNTDLLIPFGLSRGVNVSETFSNETQENPIISTINSTGQNNQSQMMIGQIPSNALGGVDQVIDALKNNGPDPKAVGATMFDNWMKSASATALGNFKDMLKGKMSGELGMVQMGNARMILPEIWTDSSFDRSYSLNFKFFSPYGNRLSIFENTIVPLIFLIAMTSPRQVGESSYTTPFCVKCFSKGLFSTDIGIVSSLSINRGEGKNDRTQEGFARTISVSMSVKDLLPKLSMSLDAGTWGILGAKNCAFRDYIAFVAGVDMADKEMVRNKFDVYLSVLRNKYSVDKIKSNLRYSFSNTLPIRLITNPRSIFYKEEKGDTLRSTSLPSSFYATA